MRRPWASLCSRSWRRRDSSSRGSPGSTRSRCRWDRRDGKARFGDRRRGWLRSCCSGGWARHRRAVVEAKGQGVKSWRHSTSTSRRRLNSTTTSRIPASKAGRGGGRGAQEHRRSHGGRSSGRAAAPDRDRRECLEMAKVPRQFRERALDAASKALKIRSLDGAFEDPPWHLSFVRCDGSPRGCGSCISSSTGGVGASLQAASPHLRIAAFYHDWQVFTLYGLFLVPLSIVLRDRPWHVQYAYAVTAIAPIDVMGFALGTSIRLPGQPHRAESSGQELHARVRAPGGVDSSRRKPAPVEARGPVLEREATRGQEDRRGGLRGGTSCRWRRSRPGPPSTNPRCLRRGSDDLLGRFLDRRGRHRSGRTSSYFHVVRFRLSARPASRWGDGLPPAPGGDVRVDLSLRRAGVDARYARRGPTSRCISFRSRRTSCSSESLARRGAGCLRSSRCCTCWGSAATGGALAGVPGCALGAGRGGSESPSSPPSRAASWCRWSRSSCSSRRLRTGARISRGAEA